MSGVRVLTPDARSKTAHDRAAELVQEQRRLTDRLDSFFREVAEVSELLKTEGSLWAGPVLDPPVEAAYGVWAATGPRETRIELDRVGPVPLMPLEPDRPGWPERR
jgi:hypothetical protein